MTMEEKRLFTTCPFCGNRVRLIDGGPEPHPLCDRLARQYPNATRYTAPADPANLTKVIDRWGYPGWLLVAELDDRRKNLLRVYSKNGTPRYLPRAKGRREPERMLLHRDNIQNPGAI